MGRRTRGKGVAMQSDAGGGGQLGADGVVGQGHRVIAGLSDLILVAEARPIARAGRVGLAGIELHLGSRNRHHQHVAEIGMAGAGEMGVREALDRAVVIAIAGRMGIGLLEIADPAVGRELDHAERHGGAREGVAVGSGADEDVDVVIAGLGSQGRHGGQQRGQTQHPDARFHERSSQAPHGGETINSRDGWRQCAGFVK